MRLLNNFFPFATYKLSTALKRGGGVVGKGVEREEEACMNRCPSKERQKE